MFEVAQKRDRAPVHSAQFRANSVYIEQGLRGVFTDTVAGVEYRNRGVFRCGLGRTNCRVANNNAIRIAKVMLVTDERNGG